MSFHDDIVEWARTPRGMKQSAGYNPEAIASFAEETVQQMMSAYRDTTIQRITDAKMKTELAKLSKAFKGLSDDTRRKIELSYDINKIVGGRTDNITAALGVLEEVETAVNDVRLSRKTRLGHTHYHLANCFTFPPGENGLIIDRPPDFVRAEGSLAWRIVEEAFSRLEGDHDTANFLKQTYDRMKKDPTYRWVTAHPDNTKKLSEL